MAGDWIKIRTDLYEDQDVLQMSDILGTDDPTTIGLLVRFWSWADKQTIDGGGIKITKTRVDALTGRPGFAAAMCAVGWLTGEDGNLQLPNFQRHNGSSGKARALESEAKRLRRAGQKLSDNCPTKTEQKVRPEKRREEKSNSPIVPQGGVDGEASKKPDRIPTAPQALRIAALYRRKPTTQWSTKEIKAYKAIGKIDPEDLELVCQYTEAERKKGDDGRHRRDLATFLNNFTGELDRAKEAPISMPKELKQIQFID